MKAILEFNMPEDADEHQAALDGMRYKLALESISYWISRVLRGKTSLYDNHCDLSEEQTRVLEAVQKKISDDTEALKLD